MHIFITGGTGFIGREVIKSALARGHDVTALVRSLEKAPPTHPKLKLAQGALADFIPEKSYDRLIDLAWDGSAKYTDPRAFSLNIEPHFSFLQRMIAAGTHNLTIAGTCYEYGLQEGTLSENAPAQPVTYYGFAKATLHQMLTLVPDIQTKWLRYFYVYGAAQNPKSLFPQLLAAAARGDESFDMSPGDQERDFIHVNDVAHNTVAATEQDDVTGTINIGTGRAIKVADFAHKVLRHKNSALKLNTHIYPYPAHEPFSFKADIQKLKTLKGVIINDDFKM
jgi:dTDP-6-deoxy-L-talose 4-dehydrogenase (NAD+)